MNILCKIFGHRAYKRGWWGDSLYGKVRVGPIDGTGRTHFSVENECVRCGKTHTTARFHGSADLIARMQQGNTP